MYNDSDQDGFIEEQLNYFLHYIFSWAFLYLFDYLTFSPCWTVQTVSFNYLTVNSFCFGCNPDFVIRSLELMDLETRYNIISLYNLTFRNYWKLERFQIHAVTFQWLLF